MGFGGQTITTCYFLSFADHLLEKKRAKEPSLFNRDVRKTLTMEAKEAPQEAVNPGNNPYSTNPVRSSITDGSRMSFPFPGILHE
jgi:hypothetical protein